MKPTYLGPQASQADLAVYITSKTVCNKKNAQALGLMQATILPVIWQDFVTYGKVQELWDTLEACFRKVGGAMTYLQMVNMVKIQFTDLMDLLPQIQEFQDSYSRIMSNGQGKLSKDLATFMSCSSLPDSYEPTTWQYHDTITAIANYKLSYPIIFCINKHKDSNKSLEERLKHLDKAHPSTSSRW